MTAPNYGGLGVDWNAVLGSLGAGPASKPSKAATSKAKSAAHTNPVTGHPTTVDLQTGPTGLLGPLNLPKNFSSDQQFLWQLDTNPHDTQDLRTGGTNMVQQPGYENQRQSATMMTMAGAISYLRGLAVNDPQQYDEIVHQLVAAGYLLPNEARYGSYTTIVGSKFLQSAADVWSINSDKGAGAVTTWGDHINALIQGRIAAGQIDENGMPLSQGSGSQPTRVDHFSDPETVKASINDAAMSVLGRHLTDAEVAQFAGAFHGQESAFNDKSFAAQQAEAAGKTATVPDQPNLSASAQNFIDTTGGELGDDRTKALVGSYIGVLRNMMGLGSGGVSSAVS